MIKIKKIDKRWKGGDLYLYMIHNPGHSIYDYTKTTRVKKFNEIRDWCHTTWGPSCEVDDVGILFDDESTYPAWSWTFDAKEGVRRIYFRTEKEYMLAKLRWE